MNISYPFKYVRNFRIYFFSPYKLHLARDSEMILWVKQAILIENS